MPMVPTFQGGIPQVPDSGRTGRMVIDAPRPTVDYESTFQAAIRPLAYGAQAVGKILETEHARSVKAESAPGVGSRFTIALPLAQEEPNA